MDSLLTFVACAMPELEVAVGRFMDDGVGQEMSLRGPGKNTISCVSETKGGKYVFDDGGEWEAKDDSSSEELEFSEGSDCEAISGTETDE